MRGICHVFLMAWRRYRHDTGSIGKGEKMANTEKEYTMEELVQLINSQENDFIIEISLEGSDE